MKKKCKQWTEEAMIATIRVIKRAQLFYEPLMSTVYHGLLFKTESSVNFFMGLNQDLELT